MRLPARQKMFPIVDGLTFTRFALRMIDFDLMYEQTNECTNMVHTQEGLFIYVNKLISMNVWREFPHKFTVVDCVGSKTLFVS